MSTRPFEDFLRHALKEYQRRLVSAGVAPRDVKTRVECAEEFAEFLLGGSLT